MNKQIKLVGELKTLCELYQKQFGENPFCFYAPTFYTKFPPKTTNDDVIKALKKCLEQNIKLYEIYPSLIDEKIHIKPGCDY